MWICTGWGCWGREGVCVTISKASGRLPHMVHTAVWRKGAWSAGGQWTRYQEALAPWWAWWFLKSSLPWWEWRKRLLVAVIARCSPESVIAPPSSSSSVCVQRRWTKHEAHYTRISKCPTPITFCHQLQHKQCTVGQVQQLPHLHHPTLYINEQNTHSDSGSVVTAFLSVIQHMDREKKEVKK